MTNGETSRDKAPAPEGGVEAARDARLATIGTTGGARPLTDTGEKLRED